MTIADQETEAYIRQELARRFPDHSIIGEEFGESGPSSDLSWIIDPIDGTRAFISGMPLYGMLAGLLERGRPILGVVRMPELGEVYYGSSEGAFSNVARRLTVTGTESLEQAMLYINEADKIQHDAPEVFARLNRAGHDRRFANDCYPHALVAAGHVDACVDYALQPYDFLPLVALVEAAGGVITDWQGAPLGLGSDGSVVTAATPRLHAALLKLLERGVAGGGS